MRASRFSLLFCVVAMAAIVLASNILVQYPLSAYSAHPAAALLTLGAFTYPFAFLVTDLTNRAFGPRWARSVALVGFGVAVLLSALLATPRIAVASGTAFLVAQLVDVAVFDRLRRGVWWRAPLASSVIGSAVDTALFFSLAFAPGFAVLGPTDAYAVAQAALPYLGVETARWVAWALGDFAVKLLMALSALAVYGGLAPARDHGAAKSGSPRA